MYPGAHRLLIVITVVLLLAAPLACVKVRGPGIIPPVDENGFGEWLIQNMGYSSLITTSGESARNWSISTRFSPEKGGEELDALDITVTVDGEAVPFTFEEDEQLLESAVSSHLSQGIHEFFINPSQNAVHPFPTLRVRFEAP